MVLVVMVYDIFKINVERSLPCVLLIFYNNVFHLQWEFFQNYTGIRTVFHTFWYTELY